MSTVEKDIPIQPVERPILCGPYTEPSDHWIYDKETGQAKRAGTRRPAGYWYKTEKTGSAQQRLFFEEERDDLPLVNLLRDEVRRWREADYRGATNVTKDLLRYWAREDRPRRLFFCQREAVETIIYLSELRIPGKSSRTGFQKFQLSDDDLGKLLRGEKPGFELSAADFYPTLVDPSGNPDLIPLRRLGCKMATGSGKTVVMSMLIAWAFCNRGRNLASREFPNAVVVCCPNLTVKERLQVLRPENPENYYAAFDIVPEKYRPLMQVGKVLVTNWHAFAFESEHKEGDKNYAVVNKGPETPETFARRVLGDLYDRMPIMVLNDEGHHCWRPAQADEDLSGDEAKSLSEEAEEARVWARGLDWLNSAGGDKEKRGIGLCVDLSATPFYIKGSGHPEGYPFPWLVSDFGLVDAIESGIVKIPRLPVLDTTGRPDPKYFRLWKWIVENLQPGEKRPGGAGRPKAEVVYREAEAALKQIAGQWVERFEYIQQASPGQERVPPVLIIVCDNIDIADIFFRKISGESEEEIVTEADVRELLDDDEGEEDAPQKETKKAKAKTRTVYGKGAVFPKYFSNIPAEKRTIRIDTKLLAEAESEDPNKKRRDIAEELRRVVATVGKPGQPGEHVRCVVSVAMLTEGWDANNVTHVLGIRAFGSQLLCEQVVGRGLRRMDYTPDPKTGLLTEEYVDVYGIPFSVIPFKGRPVKQAEPDDKPKNHVKALETRKQFEMRFPVVEGYAFALRRNAIRCDIEKMEPLIVEPNREPTATFLSPTVGYREGNAAQTSPFGFNRQDRQAYYQQTHLQEIEFQIARLIVDQFVDVTQGPSDAKRRALRLQSRHQLFPQVFRFVQQYVDRKVDFRGENKCELGLEKYVTRTVERLRDAVMPDDEAGEAPLLPVLNRYKPVGTTAEVNFKTTRTCYPTQKSHIDQVVTDTQTWESSGAFRLELCQAVKWYARNDHLDLTIPYDYQGVDHAYEPDFLVRLQNDVTVVLEIKGEEDEQDRAKHTAARRWIEAVNEWGELGKWHFHVCRDPQMLEKELARILNSTN
jgi:type III restriction enzyme